VRHGLIAETVIDVLEDAEDLPTGVSVSSMLPGRPYAAPVKAESLPSRLG
jgi:hypothetical protein